jgi:hypothetical protein
MITSSNKLLRCEVLACITATFETHPPENLPHHFTMSNWSRGIIHEFSVKFLEEYVPLMREQQLL